MRPLRHGVYRSHQPAHQLENDDEKEHHIHTLLHGGRTVGNGNTEPRHNEAEKQRHHIDDPNGTNRDKPIGHPRNNHSERENQQPDNPIRYQLGERERQAADRRHIDLLYGSRLLFAHQIEGGQKTADHDDQDNHQGRNHVNRIIKRRIVAVLDEHLFFRQSNSLFNIQCFQRFHYGL